MEEFNGIVSLLFACIELLLLFNLLFFSQKSKENVLAIVMVFLLFSYQFMEFLICYLEIQHQVMIYLAFVTITFLPPLGLYFVITFIGRKNNYSIFVFIPGLLFIIYYLFVIDHFEVTHCSVLYAIYNYPLGDLYGFFYYMPILLTIILLVVSYKKEKVSNKKVLLRILLVGYLLVFIPAIILLIIFPQLIHAAESILCKFAFILALSYTFFVLKNKKKGVEN